MQFSAAIISAITVAVASASVLPRDVIFSVSDFSAGCIPHSTQCSINFNVKQPGTMETTGVTCKALVSANGGDLPDIAQWGGACEQSARTFWLTHTADGIIFTVSQQVTPSSNQTGSVLIPSSDLTSTNTTIGTVQSYTGPSTLDLA